MMFHSSENEMGEIDYPVDSKKKKKCPYCIYTCKHVSDLWRHIASHARIRPYVCSVCHRSFTLKHHMQDHMRLHTGEKPFKCGKCGQTFCWKVQLRRHENNAH